MRSIYYDVHRRGGVAATHELLRDGHTSHQLTAAVRHGEVIRIRQGHYGCPELSRTEIEAVRVGGRLTGLAGARFHGIWTPADDTLEVGVRPHSRALRTPTDSRRRLADTVPPAAKARWRDRGAVGTRSVLNPVHCLRDIVLHQPQRMAFAAVESALFRGIVSLSRWRRESASLPRRKTGQIRAVDRSSQSGGESLLKYDLLCAAIRFRQQVAISGVGQVDFLVGARLVIEVDGAEFHTSRASFEEDRRRDAVLSALGYRVLRFSYWQVLERGDEVGKAIAAALARGDHLA